MGYSAPQNKELMRVFRDLDMVEQLGSGVPRILEYYPRSITDSAPILSGLCYRMRRASIRPSDKPVTRLTRYCSFAQFRDLSRKSCSIWA